MNEAELEKVRQGRVELAASIKADPDKYKVCLVCRSISHKGSEICVVCGAYRWKTSAKAVNAAATEASKHAFPATLGYAPSYPRNYELPVVDSD